MQQQVSEQEEERRFENEYERTRKEALERMKQAEEKRKADEQTRMEDLRKQMEELKLREEEVWRLWKKPFRWRRMMLQTHRYLLLDSSSEGGAGGSVGQAVAAGEDRGGKETGGREAEEVWNAVREH